VCSVKSLDVPTRWPSKNFHWGAQVAPMPYCSPAFPFSTSFCSGTMYFTMYSRVCCTSRCSLSPLFQGFEDGTTFAPHTGERAKNVEFCSAPWVRLSEDCGEVHSLPQDSRVAVGDNQHVLGFFFTRRKVHQAHANVNHQQQTIFNVSELLELRG
jgi:hypothetical protein